MSGEKFLSRDEILGADDLPVEVVRVREWGGSVRVRGMTGAERDAWEVAVLVSPEGSKQKQVRATMLAHCIVDEKGAKVFTPEDVEALGKKSAKALNRVYSVAQRLSRVTAADLEELEGNLNAAPSAASTSSSPKS